MAEPLKYVVPAQGAGVASGRADNPDPDVQAPPQEDPAYGFNPYRGTEAHGVPIKGGYPSDPTEDDVQETFKDFEPPARVDLREQEPVPTVEVYSEQVTKRIVATTRQLPLPQNTWVKVAEDNPRRTSLYFWFDPSPQTTERIYFQAVGGGEGPVSSTGICPFITSSGQQVGLYPMEFTNELWIQTDGTGVAGAGYRIHIFEEYEKPA